VFVIVCGQPGGKPALELVEVPVDVLVVVEELVVVEVVELPYSLFLGPYVGAETEGLLVAVPHNVNLELEPETGIVMVVVRVTEAVGGGQSDGVVAEVAEVVVIDATEVQLGAKVDADLEHRSRATPSSCSDTVGRLSR
jgi:hypothetical protein